MSDCGVSCGVPVTLFDTTNFFIVDTGASHTILDEQFAPKLGEMLRNDADAKFYNCPAMAIGTTPVDLKKVACLDLKRFTMILGRQVDGIIGVDFLTNHVVIMDFNDNQFCITTSLPPNTVASSVAVPLNPTNGGRFTVTVTINTNITRQPLLDSGESSSIALKTMDWVKAASMQPEISVAKSVAQRMDRSTTCSALMRLLNFRVGTNDYWGSVCAMNPNDTTSSLGLGFLRKHICVFDFPHRTLYLRPSKNFDAIEQTDMSGLHLLRIAGQFVVYSIDEGPAATAGIKPNDVIKSVNGKQSSAFSIHDLRELLKSGEGALIKMSINRNGDTKDIEFRLHKFI